VFSGVAVIVGATGYGLVTDDPRWADVLWWTCLSAVAATCLIRRRIPWAALLVLGLGYMISLSWGTDSPTRLAGSLALTSVLLLTDGMPPVRSPGRRVTAMLGAIVLMLSGAAVVDHHDRKPYLDLPRALLTKDLGDVTPAMWGIRTNPSTYRYIEQIRDCVRRFPASKVAVLPDNPFVYPALGLHNPFPVEWPLPLELVGDGPRRMIIRAQELNREGDYLVLFQTVLPQILTQGGPVPEHVAANSPSFDHVDLENDIRALLTGQVVTCGSFIGRWAPGS
jgi:hypothetical protein